MAIFPWEFSSPWGSPSDKVGRISTQVEIAAGVISLLLFVIAGLLYDAVKVLNRIEDKLK